MEKLSNSLKDKKNSFPAWKSNKPKGSNLAKQLFENNIYINNIKEMLKYQYTVEKVGNYYRHRNKCQKESIHRTNFESEIIFKNIYEKIQIKILMNLECILNKTLGL